MCLSIFCFVDNLLNPKASHENSVIHFSESPYPLPCGKDICYRMQCGYGVYSRAQYALFSLLLFVCRTYYPFLCVSLFTHRTRLSLVDSFCFVPNKGRPGLFLRHVCCRVLFVTAPLSPRKYLHFLFHF